jgi:hypothetical protein
MTQKQALLRSYIISFFYVGFSTICLCSVYPSDYLYGDWVLWGIILTLPISVFSMGVRYAEPNQILLVYIIQFLIFIILGWVLYRRFFRKKLV